MRQLTMKEVTESHGGVLPPNATLRPDADPTRPAPPAPAKRKVTGQRFALLNAVVDFDLAALTGAEAKVWLVLFRDTKVKTDTARTGQEDIARRAGLSARGVRKALVKLQAKGLVRVARRGRLNAGPSHYRLCASASA